MSLTVWRDGQWTTMATVITLAIFTARSAPAQVTHSLETAAGLRPHNVVVEPAELHGLKGVRITLSESVRRRFAAMSDDDVNEAQARVGQYAVVETPGFSDGAITADIAGAPAPGAGAAARGFVGIAFRLRDGAYDVFTLRMTNGRAEEQTRRNHAAQYASHPDWPWFRLRAEAPSRYESYVDLQPDTWTSVRIEVRGTRARLYVHGQSQPTLVVNDLKSGTERTGQVALWVNHGTVAHFRNLTITPLAPPAARGVTLEETRHVTSGTIALAPRRRH